MSKYKTREEKELQLVIASLKNVLTDVPYDFMYDGEDEDFELDSLVSEENMDNIFEDDKDRFKWEDETLE